ncbi:MAG TPA: serine protease [Thermoguttaceae bacterium]
MSNTILIRFLAMAVALCAASAAWAQIAPPGQSPHPAIVRIIAPDRNGVAFGSGSLVAVSDTYGLVVTNWHVVRDAAAPIWVAFPNGFYSAATVLKTDRDWDLAALAIWRPNVQPLPVANQAPVPGERLTIAGYGSGWFRTATGQCTQYVSPGGNNPFEMIELSAPARDGDSGGPILNDRGELAGVLFGSAFGQTTGSYCGRLRWFLASVADDFQRLPEQNIAIAQQPSSPMAPVAAIGAQPSTSVASAYNEPKPLQGQTTTTFNPKTTDVTSVSSTTPAGLQTTAITIQPSSAASSWFDQARNYLAIIGLVALLIQGLRLMGKLAE